MSDSSGHRTNATAWWRDAVIYQVYVRSFSDSDGDGVGDLPGVRSRLDDLVELGVDAIWMNPFYPSPQADAGYDVADYCEVDPLFGSLEEFDRLLSAAHDRGLRVIVDLVPNHTSDQHPWFREALASPPGSAARRRYLFRGVGDGSSPPNDWQSVFGGPAWTRLDPDGSVPGEWYLHLFAPEQPDLDWTNPEVREEFESILRFWLDRGVDGFRIDVAHGLAKDPGMPDLAGRYETAGLAHEGHPHWDQDEVHEVYRRWRQIADEYEGDRMFVAEAYLTSPERLSRYVRADELHTAFNFRFLLAPWDGRALRESIESSISSHAAIGAPPTWVLANHDVPRVVTRYGGGELGRRRARAAALMMLALPGAAYVYQGDELGLEDVGDLPDDVRQDPTFRRTGGAEVGRDGCRVPIPWDDSPSFGFSPDGSSWLPQPAGWVTLTRTVQQRTPGSMLALYRDALTLRRTWRDSAPGDRIEWLDLGPDVVAFGRGDALISITNAGSSPIEVADLRTGALLLASGSHSVGDPVPPDTTCWFRPER